MKFKRLNILLKFSSHWSFCRSDVFCWWNWHLLRSRFCSRDRCWRDSYRRWFRFDGKVSHVITVRWHRWQVTSEIVVTKIYFINNKKNFCYFKWLNKLSYSILLLQNWSSVLNAWYLNKVTIFNIIIFSEKWKLKLIFTKKWSM